MLFCADAAVFLLHEEEGRSGRTSRLVWCLYFVFCVVVVGGVVVW